MNFRKYLIIPAVFLLAVLIVQPALSAENLTGLLSGKNVSSITNYTADLEKDVANRYYNYGVQSLNLGDFTSAIRYFDQALAENITMMKKTDALLYLYQNKAYSQMQLGKYADAMTTLDAGLAIYPADAMLWNNRGWALQNLGKTQEALAAYDRAISIDANYTNALLNRANLLNLMGRNSEAAATFIRANETDPFNIAASEGLEAARKGEAASGSTRTMTLVLGIGLLAAAAIAVWFVKFRHPAEPAPEEKKKRSKKK